MKRVFEIIKSNRVLAKNFTSLWLLQISNYLLPLITLPYIVRVLGPEKYGIINFAAALTAYFTIVTDYGFNLSATREISIYRDDKVRLSQIFSSVLIVKLILFLISSVLFFILLLLIPQFKNHSIVFILTYITVLGGVLFPNWFYQGTEKMGYMVFINIGFKIISTILIFVLITSESDFIKLVIINSFTQVIIGFTGCLIVLIKFKLTFVFPGMFYIKEQFRSGRELFISSISSNIYTNSSVFLLGLFASQTAVGYFAAADKIRIAAQGLYSPLSQAVFPVVTKKINESYNDFKRFVKNLFRYTFVFNSLISLCLFIFADFIVNIILGDKYQESVMILRIIGWLPLIVSLNNVAGVQTIIPMDLKKTFTIILSLAALSFLILSFIFVPVYYGIGSAFVLLATEFIILIALVFVLRRKDINFFLG